MRGEKVICAREGCNIEFFKRTHNMKYHDDECCRLATNARLMVNYYDGQARKLGKVRYCENCQVARLSRYNETLICAACKTRKRVDTNQSVLSMFENTTITV
jgi:hypothetical protein